MGSILFGEFYGTQYRVRLSSPLGYSILFKEDNLTWFRHQKNTAQMKFQSIASLLPLVAPSEKGGPETIQV